MKQKSSKFSRYMVRVCKGLGLVVFIMAVTLAILWGSGVAGSPRDVAEQVRSAIQDIRAEEWISLLAVAAVMSAYRPINRYSQAHVYERSGGFVQVAYGVVLAVAVAAAGLIIKDDILMWGITAAAIATLGWLVLAWRTTYAYVADDVTADDAQEVEGSWQEHGLAEVDETEAEDAESFEPDLPVDTQPGQMDRFNSMMDGGR